MKYTYTIIEDNPGALKNLQTALLDHPGFLEKGTASTLKAGISLVLTQKPHLIFLDVELGADNGFDLITEIRQHFSSVPYIIMTTDFGGYAKKAVNNGVLYFLDKPIDPDELIIALTKFEKAFLENQNHITIKNTQGHFFVQFDDILYIESDNNCCKIYYTNGSNLFVTRTLKDIEQILPNGFIRIHKSYIINTQFIAMLSTSKKKIMLHLNTSNEMTKNIKNNHLSNENVVNQDKISIPIGEMYLEKVRNTLLTQRFD